MIILLFSLLGNFIISGEEEFVLVIIILDGGRGRGRDKCGVNGLLG